MAATFSRPPTAFSQRAIGSSAADANVRSNNINEISFNMLGVPSPIELRSIYCYRPNDDRHNARLLAPLGEEANNVGRVNSYNARSRRRLDPVLLATIRRPLFIRTSTRAES